MLEHDDYQEGQLDGIPASDATTVDASIDVITGINAKLASTRARFVDEYQRTRGMDYVRDRSQPFPRRMRGFAQDIFGSDSRTITEIPDDLRPAFEREGIWHGEIGVGFVDGSRSELSEPHELIEWDLGNGIKRTMIIREGSDMIERGRVTIWGPKGNMIEVRPDSSLKLSGNNRVFDVIDIARSMTEPVSLN